MKLGRRFIGADINLGAIQTTTKRLINVAAELNKELPDPEHPKYTGFSVYNVNNYEVFRNPIEAKDILVQALELEPLPGNTVYDGMDDDWYVKIMPVNCIATREDLNEIEANFPIKEKDGSYLIVEVKGENMIDKPVVLAKAAYARQVAVASGMDYRLIPSLQAKLGLQSGVDQLKLLENVHELGVPEILHEVGEALMYREYLPLYTLAAACGRFGEERLVEDPADWVRISGRLTRNENLYVVRAVGHSMEPRIHDGEYCVFEYRENEVPEDNAIVLAEHADVIDGETRGSYSIKKLVHEGGKVIFRPLNPDYDDIEPDPTRGYRIVGVQRTDCQVVM